MTKIIYTMKINGERTSLRKYKSNLKENSILKEDLIKIYGITNKKLTKLENEGKIKSITIGKKVYYNRDLMVNFLN